MRPTADFEPIVRRPARRGHKGGRTLLIAGLVGAMALLTGCGTGQDAQTAEQDPGVPGVDADVRGIALRNVQIAYGSRENRTYQVGGNAPLEVRIFNNSARADALIGVSSEAAERAVLVGSPTVDSSQVCPQASIGGVRPQPTLRPSKPRGGATDGGTDEARQRRPRDRQSPTTGGQTADTGEPTGPRTPERPGARSPGAAEQPAAPAGTEQFRIDLAPGSCALLAASTTPRLELAGLRRTVQPGESVPVTFTFREAGDVTLNVPVGEPSTPPDHTPVDIHPTEAPAVGGHDVEGEEK